MTTTQNITDSPFGTTVRVVASVPKSVHGTAFGWNGFMFYTLASGELVAVVR